MIIWLFGALTHFLWPCPVYFSRAGNTSLHREAQFSSVQSLSCVRLFVTPWITARQASLSMGFSRQEYWSGLPCPPPGNLPNPGIEPASPGLPADSLLLSHEGSPMKTYLATGHFILKNTSPYKGKAAVQSQLSPTALSASLHKVKAWTCWRKWFISLSKECRHHVYKRFLSLHQFPRTL